MREWSHDKAIEVFPGGTGASGPDGAGARQRDDTLIPEVERAWQENFRVYGARRVWRQLQREEVVVARCTVARRMRKSVKTV